MLSRFALKASNTASFLPKQQSILFRILSTSNKPVASSTAAPPPAKQYKRYPHDSPERDFANFPPPTMPEEGGKLRVGFLPEEWFTAFYKKTGVTGPYILFWGGMLTAFSKEYYVSWVDTCHVMCVIGVIMTVHKLYGPKIRGWFERELQKEEDALKQGEVDRMRDIDADIVKSEQTKNLPEVNKLAHEAKRENILLQLEAAYRARLAQLNSEVRRRLDYQVAVQGVYKRLERDQAIQYILSEVNKALGPTQEREAFQSGLNQLKTLSKKHAGTI